MWYMYRKVKVPKVELLDEAESYHISNISPLEDRRAADC
jgi:hypothetical protein